MAIFSACSPGTMTAWRPNVAACTAASRPRQCRKDPSSPSSPKNSRFATALAASCSDATKMARAMGRSKRPPLFGNSAGAKLTVIRRSGHLKCEQIRALRTLSLDSLTELSGKPTIEKAGRPLLRWASTATSGALSPIPARDKTVA